MPKLDPETIQYLMDNCLVPPQPIVLKDLENEYRKQQPNLDEVVKLVSSDVRLTASFIKLINETVFRKTHGITQPIDCVDDAIAILGLDKTKRLIDRVVLQDSLTVSGSTTGLVRFWDSAADVAIISEYVAEQILYPLPHEAYLLGMFRDVGIPMMMKGIDGYMDFLIKANQKPEIPLPELENKTFNLNHQTVGYCISCEWNFPHVVSRAILTHHYVESISLIDKTSTNAKKNVLVSIVMIAEQIDRHFRSMTRENQVLQGWEPIDPIVLNNLDVTESEMLEIRDNAMEMMESLLQQHGR